MLFCTWISHEPELSLSYVKGPLLQPLKLMTTLVSHLTLIFHKPNVK